MQLNTIEIRQYVNKLDKYRYY